jgi:hypothetical protein
MNKYQQNRTSNAEEIRTAEELRHLTDAELDAVTGGARVVTACATDNAWETWIATYYHICPGDTSYP